MLGLGFGEIILILIVALLVLGPEKLPQIARQMGKGLREFRRLANDFQHNLNEIENDTRQALETKALETKAPDTQALETKTPDTQAAPLSAPDSEAAEQPVPPPPAEPMRSHSAREPDTRPPMERAAAGPSVNDPESGFKDGLSLEEVAKVPGVTLAPSHTIPRDAN